MVFEIISNLEDKRLFLKVIQFEIKDEEFPRIPLNKANEREIQSKGETPKKANNMYLPFDNLKTNIANKNNSNDNLIKVNMKNVGFSSVTETIQKNIANMKKDSIYNKCDIDINKVPKEHVLKPPFENLNPIDNENKLTINSFYNISNLNNFTDKSSVEIINSNKKSSKKPKISHNNLRSKKKIDFEEMSDDEIDMKAKDGSFYFNFKSGNYDTTRGCLESKFNKVIDNNFNNNDINNSTKHLKLVNLECYTERNDRNINNSNNRSFIDNQKDFGM